MGTREALDFKVFHSLENYGSSWLTGKFYLYFAKRVHGKKNNQEWYSDQYKTKELGLEYKRSRYDSKTLL